MQQLEQLDIQEQQFQQDYYFIFNRRLVQLKTPFGPQGWLCKEDENHMVCKLFNLNLYQYDKIFDLGIDKFQDQIKYYQDQLRIHQDSINNFGVIHYLHQGQLPLYYYHSDWDFTLYNCLLKHQYSGQQMNKDTIFWIIKQLAYIINLQHENSIYQLNTSIENIVFKQYFNFRFIEFYQEEVKGQLEAFYRYIIRNFLQQEQQFQETDDKSSLQKIIRQQFSSSDDSQYILNFNPDNQPNRMSEVQIFLYQLSLYAGSFHQTINNINYDTLVRHHTLQICNFDCAVKRDPQLMNYQIPDQNLQMLSQPLQHPNIQDYQTGLQQQDYYCLGIVIGQIYMANFSTNNIQIETQTGNPKDLRVLSQFLPNDFIGLLSDEIDHQEEAFVNIQQNLQFNLENVQFNLQYLTQEDIDANFYQQ